MTNLEYSTGILATAPAPTWSILAPGSLSRQTEKAKTDMLQKRPRRVLALEATASLRMTGASSGRLLCAEKTSLTWTRASSKASYRAWAAQTQGHSSAQLSDLRSLAAASAVLGSLQPRFRSLLAPLVELAVWPSSWIVGSRLTACSELWLVQSEGVRFQLVTSHDQREHALVVDPCACS